MMLVSESKSNLTQAAVAMPYGSCCKRHPTYAIDAFLQVAEDDDEEFVCPIMKESRIKRKVLLSVVMHKEGCEGNACEQHANTAASCIQQCRM